MSKVKLNNIKYISTKQELASRLKYIRQIYNFRQHKVAAYLNMDRSTYAYYETNKTVPDIFTLFKLCHFYNIDINYFILKKNIKYRKYLKGLMLNN